MSVLSLGQAATYAQQAGFSGQSLGTILAISEAESGLNTNAYNPNDPYGGSYGIVQINGAHFSAGGTTKACALDPACAYKYAYQLSGQGKNFTAWGSYTNGAYLRYINQAITNVGTATTSGPGTNNTPRPPQDSSSPDFITGLTEHVLVFLIALVLIVVGFIIIARPAVEAGAERGAFL